MASQIESWDDDADFQGDLFAQSIASTQSRASFSSRASVRSESVAADEDWQVLIAPNDEASTSNAISSAKQAGIPIPANVPSSALLGGTIKRLGKKKSRRKLDDDWGDDIELPTSGNLTLKSDLTSAALKCPTTPLPDQDEFDEWAEGSLGIRFAGTRRELRGRSSSASGMSPSIGSCVTAESEDDGLDGLVLPDRPLDFNALLKKRKETDIEPPASVPPTSAPPMLDPPVADPPAADPPAADPPAAEMSVSQRDPPVSPPPPAEMPVFQRDPFPAPMAVRPRTAGSQAVPEESFDDIDFGGDIFDPKKFKLNRNVKVQSLKAATPAAKSPVTTITFTDKPLVSRIPRPTSKSSNLAPVLEPGASHISRIGRAAPTTTSAQLLKMKRSAPVLRNHYPSHSHSHSQPKNHIPFLPAGVSSNQSHHVTAKSSFSSLRRDSDPNRPGSPTSRPYSRQRDRISDTPSRIGLRKDPNVAPPHLARDAATRRTLNRPTRQRNWGDGSELDIFDDLPTSATKEQKFIKQPVSRGPPRSLRHLPSRLGLNQEAQKAAVASPSASSFPSVPSTPVPPSTPGPRTSGVRAPGFEPSNTPRFARDTAASRIAREQRLSQISIRPRSEGPLMPVTTNWKATIAARTPTVHSAKKKKDGETRKPFLIKGVGGGQVRNEKGMVYNPVLHRWEGNENALTAFHSNPSTSTLPLHPTHETNNSRHHHTNSIPASLQLGIPPPSLQPQPTPTRPANPPSPPRPALISHLPSRTSAFQVERGMLFDPRQMKWLKLDPRSISLSTTGDPNMLSPGSLSLEEEEDPFAGLPDLPDEREEAKRQSTAAPLPGFADAAGGESETGAAGAAEFPEPMPEEFDLGPGFIRRQREEEAVWRRRVEGWVEDAEAARRSEEWRWEIRRFAMRGVGAQDA